jgi:hypothetical protein
MNVTQLSSAVIAITLGVFSNTVQANDDSGNVWRPKQPTNQYWQAPDWSGVNMQQQERRPAPPSNSYNRPAPQNYSRGQYPDPRPATGAGNQYRNAPMPPQAMPPRAMPPQNSYQGQPQGNFPQGGPPQTQPRGPYYGGGQEPSAFYTPGYRPYRNNSRNNKFWGRSGPSNWMNPNKMRMERGWDDMINTPSRMGEMPGGWTAPEVTMPNPIDMGDQMQDNLEDLPEQIKNRNIGNEVQN